MSKKSLGKVLCFIVIAVMLVSAFTGCGKAGETASTGETTTAAAQAASSETQATIASPESYSGTFTIWAWFKDTFDIAYNEFQKVYPNIKCNYVPVEGADYLKKVQTAYASGSELPDILLGEMGIRGKLMNIDMWEPLEKEPYNVDVNKQIMDSYADANKNAAGKLVGLESCICTCALAYKADLAKEYLGTDDPEELKAMLSDWNAFITKGKEVSQKSSGKVYMLAGLADAWTLIGNQNPSSLIDGEKLINADAVYGEGFKKVAQIRDSGISDKMGQWTAAWNASFADETHIFYPCPTWGVNTLLKSNDAKSNGRWRLMVPPEGGTNWGGTTWGIYKNSKVKDIVWEYLKWTYLSEEGAKVQVDKLHQYLPLKEIYPDGYDYAKDIQPDAFFNGQSIEKVLYGDILKTLKVRSVSKYDTELNDAAGLAINKMNEDSSVTGEKAYEYFKTELKNKLPDLEQ